MYLLCCARVPCHFSAFLSNAIVYSLCAHSMNSHALLRTHKRAGWVWVVTWKERVAVIYLTFDVFGTKETLSLSCMKIFLCELSSSRIEMVWITNVIFFYCIFDRCIASYEKVNSWKNAAQRFGSIFLKPNNYHKPICAAQCCIQFVTD